MAAKVRQLKPRGAVRPVPAVTAKVEGIIPVAWCDKCAWHRENTDAIERGRMHAGEHPGHTVWADEVVRHTFRAVANDVL